MNTIVTKQQLQAYLVIAIVAGLIGIFTFILLGYFEFFVGIIQLIFALIKTINQYMRDKSVSKNMTIYWKMVFVYFIGMSFGALIMNGLMSYSNYFPFIWCFYISTAWGIAVFHFKHIMFSKTK